MPKSLSYLNSVFSLSVVHAHRVDAVGSLLNDYPAGMSRYIFSFVVILDFRKIANNRAIPLPITYAEIDELVLISIRDTSENIVHCIRSQGVKTLKCIELEGQNQQMM